MSGSEETAVIKGDKAEGRRRGWGRVEEATRQCTGGRVTGGVNAGGARAHGRRRGGGAGGQARGRGEGGRTTVADRRRAAPGGRTDRGRTPAGARPRGGGPRPRARGWGAPPQPLPTPAFQKLTAVKLRAAGHERTRAERRRRPRQPPIPPRARVCCQRGEGAAAATGWRGCQLGDGRDRGLAAAGVARRARGPRTRG